MEIQRAGKEYRINPDRYFHIMDKGWYVYTREGVQGPYDIRNDAELVLKSMFDCEINTDTNNEWRL